MQISMRWGEAAVAAAKDSRGQQSPRGWAAGCEVRSKKCRAAVDAAVTLGRQPASGRR